jgi:hypothetical protein
LVLVVVLSVQYAFKAQEDRSAILRWRPQIQQLSTADIYLLYNFPNPPILPILLTPLVGLPPIACSLAWFFIKVAMTIFVFHWFFRIVELPARPFPNWAKVLAIALSLRPIMGDLSHGNVNLFILFLVAGAIFAYCRQQDWVSGLLIGLAISCKVTPALFLPFFVWKRAWKAVAGCVLGLVLFLIVVPGMILGMERNWELLYHWYEGMVRPFIIGGIVTTDHINQSLPGLLHRLLTNSPSFYDKGIPESYSNLVSLQPRTVSMITKACMASFAALIVWSCRTPREVRMGWRVSAEFSLVLIGMLLFSERTWKHHCVTLVLPFTVLVYYLAACGHSVTRRNYLVASIVMATLFIESTASVFENGRVAKLAEAHGAYVWAFLTLAAGIVAILHCPETRVKTDRESTPSSIAA